MWLFTRYGFFSAVCARQADGPYGDPVDPTRVMVRARRREHLDALLQRFGKLVKEPPKIRETTDTDYRFRIFLPKAEWAVIAGALANDLDYDNFKDTVHDELDDTSYGRAYTQALSEVWNVMYELQDK